MHQPAGSSPCTVVPAEGVAAGRDLRIGAGRDLVRWAAREQGWDESLPRDATIGLRVAGTTVAPLLVCGLVVGALALLGRR